MTVQCDAQEFINFFFDRMENQLRPTSQKYLMQDVFQGKSVSQNVCMGCGNTKNNVEPFYTLSLEVKNKSSVHESLIKQLDGQVIEDFKCDACN